MSSSVGKRQRERQKVEKAQAKAERRAARLTADEDVLEMSTRSESELIEDLGALHRAFEAGEVAPEDFEEHRDQLQVQLERAMAMTGPAVREDPTVTETHHA